MKKTQKLSFLSTTLGVTILGGIIFASTNSYADVTSQVTISVPVACTMSGTGMNTHNAEIQNGTSNSAIGETTIKAFCNDAGGFAVYAIGYTDNEEGNNVLTNSTLGSTYDIVTGTATSGNTSNWAMKLSTVSSPTPTYPITIQNSYDSFQQVPDDYTLVAKRTTGTDTGQSAEGSTLKTTYQAFVSKTQPAGTYTGQVKYVLVHPNDAPKPQRPTSLDTASYLQDVNYCSEDLTTEHIYTLRDSRDNQDYKVAKLADGKCWMLENLNITGGTALSSDDTDFTSDYVLPTTDGWTVTNNKLVLPASSISSFTSTGTDRNKAAVYNSGNKENCGKDGYDVSCYSYYSWGAATLGSGRTIATTNTDAPYSICPKGWRLPTSGSSANDGWKRGDFYALATAYGANLENSSQDNSSTTGVNFDKNAGPGSIPNFIHSSYIFAGSYVEGYPAGKNGGGLWSSTSSAGTDGAVEFSFGSTLVNVAVGIVRISGNPVRCIAR
ncbi:MAG: hypothetical protein Q4A70_03070 [Candidatus Saccharibacteria bacterium]|nr:hypothetical protein [Candidatus Saccharibacteria bacterium]